MNSLVVETPWKLGEKQLYSLLGSSHGGLADEEAALRRKEFGSNELAEKDKRTATRILLSQFKSPLVYLLVSAALVAFYLGDSIEAAIILFIVGLNAAMGFFQEHKSENALRKLKKYISFNSVVMRSGVKKEINSVELVPGDLVLVQIGDKIPADMRLLSTEEFQVDESTLTGESLPVSKTLALLGSSHLSAVEIRNMRLMGAIVTSRHAIGIVTATGSNTMLGKTSSSLGARLPETDFERSIRKFGSMLIRITVLMTVFVFIVNYLLGRGLLSSFLFALALAVGITPEALPIVITVALSTGAVQLASKKVVVKKLVAIENLGNMDVLCADKTGTLGENKLILEKAVDLDDSYSVDLVEKSLMCTTSVVGKWGKLDTRNLFDQGIFQYGEEKLAPKRLHALVATVNRVDVVDFDFNRKRMSVVTKQKSGLVMVTKGAAESVLQVCTKMRVNGKDISRINHAKVNALLQQYAKQGYSILAVASKSVQPKTGKASFSPSDEKMLTLLGFLLFAAPARKTTAKTISELQRAGVELKILTGDGALVTQKLCSDVNFTVKGGRIVLGSELETLSESELGAFVEKYNVFARVTPEQKFAIVLSLQRNGHVVGFVGDGVNDAPALRAADVGISVSNAVDVAKDAASLLLMHKSIETILEGVTLGRKTFGNVTKYILNTISGNFGNMFTVALSSLFLKFIPLLPSQILLNNLLSDVPLLTVSTDNVDKTFLVKPKKWDLNLISKFMVYFGLLSVAFDLLTIFLLLYWLQAPQDQFRTAWFIESVLSEIIVTFAIRTQSSFYKSAPSHLLILSSIFVGIISVVITYSAIGQYFNFVPIPTTQLALVAVILCAYFATAEIAKRRFFAKHVM